MQQRVPAPVVRLVLAAMLASFGALLVLVGIAAIMRAADGPAGGSSGSAAGAPTDGTGATPGSSGAAAPGSSAGAGPSGAGVTASPGVPDGATILVGAGDIGRCDSTADDDTAALVERLPGIVFTLGDNTYDHGTPDEFARCFGPSWGRFKDRIALPVPGNHDYDTGSAAGYREYFAAAAVPDGTTWRAEEVGPWHVVVLDSNCGAVDGGCGPDSPQVRWLRADLAASHARCTLALFHHPRFSSGEHGSDEAVGPFWDALHEAGAEIVVNGHEHSYERFDPQDPPGTRDDARGIQELIAGTGGADLRGFRDPVANSRVRASVSHGVISLTLQASSWTWTFTSIDGMFTDTGTGTCHD